MEITLKNERIHTQHLKHTQYTADTNEPTLNYRYKNAKEKRNGIVYIQTTMRIEKMSSF